MRNDSKGGIYGYQPLFGGWKIDEEIGEGSYGVVYRVSKEEMGRKYVSAVKLITIPSKEQFHEARSSFGNDEKTLRDYFEDIVHNIIREVDMLHSLSGNGNILNYHDHSVIERKENMGWDILIRMEYVRSLPEYLKENRMSRGSVLQLGIDICNALELCSKKGIIHRDIKDDNIFVSDDGIFKLGDFGIARELSKSGRAASMRGTPLYMAPEVYRGDKYDAAVDIYSLGIVLYKLLNHGRMPFMPQWPSAVRFSDSEQALERRLVGEELPAPDTASGALAAAVLKACAHKPEDRYATATQMKTELEKVLAAMGSEEFSELVTLPQQQKAAGQAETGTGAPPQEQEKAAEAAMMTVGLFNIGKKDEPLLQTAPKPFTGVVGNGETSGAIPSAEAPADEAANPKSADGPDEPAVSEPQAGPDEGGETAKVPKAGRRAGFIMAAAIFLLVAGGVAAFALLSGNSRNTGALLPTDALQTDVGAVPTQVLVAGGNEDVSGSDSTTDEAAPPADAGQEQASPSDAPADNAPSDNVPADTQVAAAAPGSAAPAATRKPTPKPAARTAAPRTAQPTYQWSDWVEALPGGVSSSGYTIEQKTQYSYQTATVTTSAWSAWQSSQPSGSNITSVEQQHKVRSKEFTTSTSSSMSGWTQNGAPAVTYGAWSAWSTTPATETSTMEVRTQQVSDPVYSTIYHYNSWRYINTSDGKYYYSYAKYQGEYYKPGSGTMLYKDSPTALSVYKYYDGHAGYLVGSVVYFNQSTTQEQTGSTSHTEYSTRSKTTTYSYWRWGAWSGWAAGAYSGSTTDKEIDNQYRYKTTTTSWSSWSAWSFTRQTISDSSKMKEQTRTVYRYKKK